ncbi:GATA transcription factor 24-like [Andrographis paniculata]|uniref:GATA transcription factor 24-like n=1 Tax=Andrographis paniculata TaxID=175694 RepID=UPI0021E7DB4D|nr:GATA transcription factor 24-like [Andrographis paniculata]
MYGPPHASVNDTAAAVHHHHHHHHHHHDDDDDNDDDVVDCSNGKDPIASPPSQIRYDPSNTAHSPHALAIDTVGPPPLFGSDIPPAAAPASGDGGADQLTLSFQGEVFVFDSVSPEKVQAVLLLLGGYEVPTGIPTAGMAQNHRNLGGDYPVRSSQSQRAASLNRFREKRKERCYDKKIRYTVRKEVALRMQRKKGQFTSSKSTSEEPGSSAAADGNGSSGQEEQETLCRHCGISSKSTPMMRRGPDGPRTLCNACGLKWANKGVLRGLSKVPIVGGMQSNAMKPSCEINAEDSAMPPTNVIMTSSGDN